MTSKRFIALIAGLAIAGAASAAPIDFSSDFSGDADWNWTSTSGATGTGAMTVNPLFTTETTGYAQKLITADGGTDVTIDYSFDLDISSLIATNGTGSQMALFSIGANGNAGPEVNGMDGARTYVYLVSGNTQGDWGFAVGSGGIWNGTVVGEIGTRLALTEAQEAALHFSGTLTLTDTVVSNTLTVTSVDGYSQTGTFVTGTLADVGAQHIDSYNLGALQEWAKESLSGDIVFDNFELTVNGGLPPEPATLSISVVSAEQIEISWVPNLPGYILQETSDLLSTNWADSVSSSTNHPIQIPTTSAEMFYRVIAP